MVRCRNGSKRITGCYADYAQPQRGEIPAAPPGGKPTPNYGARLDSQGPWVYLLLMSKNEAHEDYDENAELLMDWHIELFDTEELKDRT